MMPDDVQDAYREGVRAYRGSGDILDNPYDSDRNDHEYMLYLAWSEGFNDARNEDCF